MKSLTLLIVLSTVLLSACGEHGHQQSGKDDGHLPATADANAGPMIGDRRTHFSEHTELYVEFPRLVAGEIAPFAAHLTRLPEFQPLTAATVTVILSGAGEPDESFSIDRPGQPGIFRPQAMPRHAGERQLNIAVATPQFTVKHALGPVTVYADRKSANAVPAPSDDGAIVFTKEQQWKIDFATATVAERAIRTGVTATGTLRPRPDAEALLTAPAPGQVHTTGSFPRLGQTVRKGEVLAYLAPRLGGDTDIASLQAGTRKAQVVLDQAIRERVRLEGLFKDEAVPEKRVQTARAAEESARAEFDAAQGRLGQYGGQGGGVPIRAPVSGIIVDVRTTPGAFAQEGALLFHIADTRTMWVELRIPESDASRIVSPIGVNLHVEGVEKGFEILAGKNGRLVAIGGAVEAMTRTLPVIFEFTPDDARLRIGLAVKAQIFMNASRRSSAVPASALIDEGGMSSVYIQCGGESFERRLVRIGARDGDWVEVTDGLVAGERIVTRGAYLIKLAASRPGEIGSGHVH